MKNKIWKSIFIWSASFLGLCIVVLAVHIYVVTRPKALSPNALVMARLDLKQDITQQDAAVITAWLYQQKGIDHVVCNPQNHNIVFTYFPIRTSGDVITANFKTSLPYKADRFKPTQEQMDSGCPIASTSSGYKLFTYIKNHF